MFIKCDDGRGYPDYYYIESANSLEELQQYVQNKMPVMGMKVEYKYKTSAVLKEDCTTKLIYLNNYLNIGSVALYFVTNDFLNELSDTKCESCLNYCQYVGCDLRYKPDEEEMCGNYREPRTKSEVKWLRFWRK